jgi:hypothetical protein
VGFNPVFGFSISRGAFASGQRILAVVSRIALVLAVAALAQTLVSATAIAEVPIEGVWSFNGGRVAVHPDANGELEGTVVEQTTLAQCPHVLGEAMWTHMRGQPDGSYWGYHQWFFESSCAPNPNLGKTTWRVLEQSGGGHFLRVCFGYPGAPQPLIAPDGSSSEVTSPPCIDSALVASLPSAPEEAASGSGSTAGDSAGALAFAQYVAAPSASRCVSRRSFTIHIRDPRNDPIKRVAITLRRRRVAAVRRGHMIAATVDLAGLPEGAYTLRISAITVLGHRFSASRTYHTCSSRRGRA